MSSLGSPPCCQQELLFSSNEPRVLNNTHNVMTIANDDCLPSSSTCFSLIVEALADHTYCQQADASDTDLNYGYRMPGMKTNGQLNEYLLRVIDTQNNQIVLQPVTVRFCVKEGGGGGEDDEEDTITCLCSDCISTTESNQAKEGWKLEEDGKQVSMKNSTDMKGELQKKGKKKLDLLPHVSSAFIPAASCSTTSFTAKEHHHPFTFELPSTSKGGFGLYPPLPLLPPPPTLVFSDGIPTTSMSHFQSLNDSNNNNSSKSSRVQRKKKKRKALEETEDEETFSEDTFDDYDDQPTKKKRKEKRQRKRPTYLDLPCYHCGRTFANRGNLQKHLLKTLGVLPYTCPACQCGFLLKKHLKAHDCDHQSMRERASSAAASDTALTQKEEDEEEDEELEEEEEQPKEVEGLDIFSD